MVREPVFSSTTWVRAFELGSPGTQWAVPRADARIRTLAGSLRWTILNMALLLYNVIGGSYRASLPRRAVIDASGAIALVGNETLDFIANAQSGRFRTLLLVSDLVADVFLACDVLFVRQSSPLAPAASCSGGDGGGVSSANASRFVNEKVSTAVAAGEGGAPPPDREKRTLNERLWALLTVCLGLLLACDISAIACAATLQRSDLPT